MIFAANYNDPIYDQDGTFSGGLTKLIDQHSILFSYLPTKIFEYKFPILINANFLTNVNREQIHLDSAWNQWLFHKIGSEIFQWIKELVCNEQFGSQAYYLLPLKLKTTHNILSKCFNQSYETSISHCNFILNRTNQLLRVDQVIMDSTLMSKQLSFINIYSMRQYIMTKLTNSSSEYADQPFIDCDPNLLRIGVRQFTWHDCVDMFKSEIFLKTHSVEDNISMIEYFYTQFSRIEMGCDLHVSIEQIPFIMDQNNCLQASKDIYFSMEIVKNNSRGNSKDVYVHPYVFNWLNQFAPKGIYGWLQSLGVIERTDLTYLHKTILPNVTTYITLENAIETIEILFMLFEKNSIAEQCYFSDHYKPRLPLETYLKSKKDRFLSFDYISNSICKKSNDNLAEWRRFFLMLNVQEELRVIEYQHKLTIQDAIQAGFHRQYLKRTSPDGRSQVDSYSGLKTITFLEYTKNDYEFAKCFWSYVLNNVQVEKLLQNIRIYWTQRGWDNDKSGAMLENAGYVAWFVKNTQCIPTILNTCELAKDVFIDTKEMKDLCDKYLPFPSFSTVHDTKHWQYIFNFKTNLSSDNYFDLLEKIHLDEQHLNDNLERIQLIYSYILKEIPSWSKGELIKIHTRANKMYLLTENNQWKLAKTLFVYIEENGMNNNLGDIIPCLKLDFKNKTERHLQMLLELFNIKQIKVTDLKLVAQDPTPAQIFRNKLIEISPFLKAWLTKLSYPSDVISSIDSILQEKIDFIESDCLQFYFDGKLIQETYVYNDILSQKFYINRPWKGEMTLMELPKKLCQLLNIEKFDDKLGFLLRANKKDIIKHFQKLAIELLIARDVYARMVVIFYSSEETNSMMNRPRRSLSSESNDKQIDNIQLIDISLIATESSMFTTNLLTKIGNNEVLDSDIGIRGEQIIYEYLLNEYRHQLDSVSIKWENEFEESHLPYDILLIRNGKTHYIEVKSTRTCNHSSFPLSFNQIEAIIEHEENYFIYRISLEDKKLFILDNIRRRLKQKQQLSCFLTIESS
ncbi:hypothetical protein I4U23_022928 [Adineta vaga]|nr:hypothetical protein I4U23_022928 [Adineta vaga]